MGNFVEFYEFLRLQMVFGIVRCSDIVILIQLFYEINSEQVSLNLRCSMEQYLIKGGNPLVGEVEISGAKMCIRDSYSSSYIDFNGGKAAPSVFGTCVGNDHVLSAVGGPFSER